MQQLIACPQVGHLSFENSLKHISIGEMHSSNQVSRFIRPATCTVDQLGMTYAEKELQKKDLSTVPLVFAYPNFVFDLFHTHRDRFRDSECRIYQFQNTPRTGNPFIFGLFITDDQQNLIDFCVESTYVQKRRSVLLGLMRAVCTSHSLLKRFAH